MSYFEIQGCYKKEKCIFRWQILNIAESGDHPINAIPANSVTKEAYGTDDRFFKREVLNPLEASISGKEGM